MVMMMVMMMMMMMMMPDAVWNAPEVVQKV